MKSLTSLRGMDEGLLVDLLDRADLHKKRLESREQSGSELVGTRIATVFYEPSTRTRLSFETAASNLGASVMTFTPETSSISKGESLRDTMLTLVAMGSDLLVVRHGSRGAPELVAAWTGAPVINAGDGKGEHPTQALTDALTLRRHFGSLRGLRMGIVGDVRNSRVARSLLWAMPTLGVDLTLVGPSPLLPVANPWAVSMATDLDESLTGFDVVYLLRMQTERSTGDGLAGLAGYTARYGLTRDRLGRLAPDAVIMHPGPINRGVEVGDEAADSPRSLILEQVRNGVPVRMAVLEGCLASG